ncbi:YihY/virulence factor BrkB family protein [Paraburkholderia sp. CNPSo 3274]|uniref:YihY/virulence factor BrkB family protein n=1 Tax=Paraburkholderia sp. CNPSo 3274 TaxID=2940932 RepID=UPI0020B87E93|nr:YihY/virulence factor BrkB family protein [Paraburkholderia sp. CNPSo 3274]MCP3711552.1 YihY/virulence factor BrkB family protein [Paraburkholderia sp. CNPSo 3274]
MKGRSQPVRARSRTGLRGCWAVASKAVNRFGRDRCSTLAASIGFFSAFSLAPTLIIALAIAGRVFGADAARGRLFAQIHDIMGNDAAAAMQAIVAHAHRSGQGGFAAFVSVILLAIGASATFTSLNTALDVVFDELALKNRSSISMLIRARLMSLGMVMGVGFLLVVSLVLDAAIEWAGDHLFGVSPLAVIAQVVQTVLAFAVLAAAFAALMKFMPDARVPLKHAIWGGLVAALLFSAGRHVFGLYLAHAGTANEFGAAGSLAVLMMWLYFSAATFLLGAEVAASIGRARLR